MTQQKCDTSSQLANSDAEIAVTPAMIAAAERVYEDWQSSSEWDYRKVFARMFREMVKASHKAP